MRPFLLSVAAAVAIAIVAALALGSLGWESETVHQSTGNVRL